MDEERSRRVSAIWRLVVEVWGWGWREGEEGSNLTEEEVVVVGAMEMGLDEMGSMIVWLATMGTCDGSYVTGVAVVVLLNSDG